MKPISRYSITLMVLALLPASLWSAEFTVNSTADQVDADLTDGKCDTNLDDDVLTCTLRAAIQEANVDFEKDTIIIPPGIYTLTLKSTPGDLAADGIEEIPADKMPARTLSAAGGDLDILSFLEIKKSDATGEVILDGGEKFRFFDIQMRMDHEKDFRAPDVTLSDLKFINGSAATHGGAIQCSCSNLTLNNIHFENNSSKGHGGALFNYSNQTSLNNVTFINNDANGFGGAIYSQGWDRALNIKNTTFTNNSSISSGGAIYADGNKLLIEESQFSRNDANEGGALFIYQAKTTLSNLVIERNSSKNNGGGLYQKEGNLEINNKTAITDNRSGLSGAGVYINEGIFYINKKSETEPETAPEPVLIERNISSVSGGGIYMYSRKTPAGVFIHPEAYINHSIINNNSATGENGGAIYASGIITLNSVNITNNDSKKNGAGVFITNKSIFNWKDGELKNNKNSNNGGGLYIVDRSSASIESVTIENNVADNGAGIYSASNGLLHISDSTISRNRVNLTNQGFGGGIFLEGAIAMIAGSTFDGNGENVDNDGSVAKGGAIIAASSDLYIYNSTFKNNVAVSGGAINSLKTQNNFNGRTTLNRVLLQDNRSTLYGGAIYHEVFSQLELINSTVRNNSAVKLGGGISALGPIEIRYSSINGNHSENGGGLYNQASATIENSTISGNSANTSGGGIYNAASNLADIDINSATLAFNSASTSGSNIFADETSAGETTNHGTITITNSIISNPLSGANCIGSGASIVSKGYNISSDSSCYLTHTNDQNQTDPLLTPELTTTDDSSQFHTLSSNSPAINQADPATCPVTDQRYHERGTDRCDIGAYESGSSRINSGTIEFEQAIYRRGEQFETARITVTRTGSSTGDVSVELFDLRNGTASEATTMPVNPTGAKDYLRITTSLSDFGDSDNGQDTQAGSQTILSQFIRKLKWSDGNNDPITFTIKLGNDTQNEGTETVNLGLRNPTNGALLGTNSTTVLEILDDDTDAGLFAFEKTTYTAKEGSTITIKLRRVGGYQGKVTIDFETVTDDGKDCEGNDRKGVLIPATEGADYAYTSGTLTFEDDEKEKIFTVEILAETASEKDETVKLVLKNPTGGASLQGTACTAVISIDDSHPGEFQLAQTEITIDENNSDNALIVVERLGSFNGTVTIDYNLTGGTAVAGEDYRDISGTLKFADDERLASFIIPILDDSIFEPDLETLTVNLFNPQSLDLPDFPVLFSNQTDTATATVTIKDNDIEGYTPGTFSFTAVSNSRFNSESNTWDIDENFSESSSDIELTVTRSAGSDNEVTLGYKVTGGTAREGQHFKAHKDTVTFAAGESGSKTLRFSVYDDPFWSEDKTATLALTIEKEGDPDGPKTAALGEPITLKFINDDPKPEDPGTFAFNLVSYSTSETSGAVEIKILRSDGTDGTVRVDFSTVSLEDIENNAATPHVDYSPRENIGVTFTHGQASKTLSITILEDEDTNEADEIFQLELKNPQGGAKLALRRTLATVTIKDADKENDNGNNRKVPGGPDAYSGTGATNIWILFLLSVIAIWRSVPALPKTNALGDWLRRVSSSKKKS